MHIDCPQVRAGHEPGLEQPHRPHRVGDGHPLVLHDDMPRTRKDIEARVRIARMDKDLLVLLEPGIYRIPGNAHMIGERPDRRLLVHDGRCAHPPVADVQVTCPPASESHCVFRVGRHQIGA